ncbi:Ig-like domain-containing domain [Pollutibacter soli]|uniref:Ig-like domain-containing domain n=1 Tax=Pollutibacter soli TaxID=3034157 RepID=UPI003013D2DB
MSLKLFSRIGGSACLLLMFFLLVYGCGQPLPPTGGPRDTLPPVLVKAAPGENTINFQGNRIVLEFDEYVALDNPFEKLIYSPVPKVVPSVEGKLKTVIIRLKDTLEPNTTYSIDFGNAIKDINENNILRNFHYTFSTGSYIDSLTLHGRVFIAETGKTDSTMIVTLYRDPVDDSTVAKQTPRYYTRVDRDGNFSLTHLAAGSYHIYALRDVDGGRKFDQSSELIGFLDGPVQAGQAANPVLYAFEEPYKEEEIEKKSTTAKPKDQKDKDKDDKRLKYSTNLQGGKLDILGNLELNFENPLSRWDSSKLLLTDETFNPAGAYTLRQDTIPKKLILTHQWVADKKYNLVLVKDFAADSLGHSIMKTDTIPFAAKAASEYGSVRLDIKNLDTTDHPRLMFFKGDNEEMSLKLNNQRVQIPLFRPGEYEIRILYDRNNNGVWDTGDYWKKIQPERVVARKQKLNVRPNWDNEFIIDLSDVNN